MSKQGTVVDPRLRELVHRVVELRALAKRLKAKRPPDGIPTPDALLRAALAHAGLRSNDGLTPAERLKLLHSLRLVAKAWLRREAERTLAEISPEPEGKALGGKAKEAAGRFFKKAGEFLRNAFVAGALALFGPHELTQAEIDGIDRAHAVQLEYMGEWERDVLAERAGLDPARAELYGRPVWPVAHKILREKVIGSEIFVEELRVHVGPRTATDPCDDCSHDEDEGWQPIGTLRSIGDSQCGDACHCHFVYRTEDGTEYIAGRGPLDEFAFGRTG